jgi:hypothetical protein
MRKVLLLIIGVLIGLSLGIATSALCQYGMFKDLPYYEYHYGRAPDAHDIDTAKVNIAIAIQKIATDGITLHVDNERGAMK